MKPLVTKGRVFLDEVETARFLTPTETSSKFADGCEEPAVRFYLYKCKNT